MIVVINAYHWQVVLSVKHENTAHHYWLPCSSLTAHTIRSTHAALAWQRSLRGLCSPGNPPASWSTRCSSDWLLLNCSSTKSCTSRTKAGCKAEGCDRNVNIWQQKTPQKKRNSHKNFTLEHFTFHVVQCVPQHFEHAHIERVTEGFVIEVDSRVRLNNTRRRQWQRRWIDWKQKSSNQIWLDHCFYFYLCNFQHRAIKRLQKRFRNEDLHLWIHKTQWMEVWNSTLKNNNNRNKTLWLYHSQEVSQQLNRNLHLIFSRPHEERRHWKTGADCREIVVRVHCTAIWKVSTWNQEGMCHHYPDQSNRTVL